MSKTWTGGEEMEKLIKETQDQIDDHRTWKGTEELDKLIKETKDQIDDHKKQVAKLEVQLSWLFQERERLKRSESEVSNDVNRKIYSFHSPKRNLPVAPVRQLSQSDSTDDKPIIRSSTSSFVSKLAGNSPKLAKRPVSCSLEDISRIGKSSSPSLLSNMKGKKFSTIDLRFFKRLSNYTRSPTRWDGSNPKLSISSMDEVISESNSVNTSTDDLDALNSSRSDEGKKSGIADCEESQKSTLQSNRGFFSKRSSRIQKDNGDLISDQSAASDEFSGENLSFSDSSGCQGNQTSGDTDGPSLDQNSGTTSSSSVSTRSEKLGKKIRSTKGMIRSKSSVFRDEDSLSQGSLFSFDTVDKLVVVENFLNLERSYVDKLKLLVEKYEHALREHSKDSLTLRHNVNTVFHHPCHLLMIHKSFLIAAQHRVKKQASGSNVPILFGDLFLEMVNQFKVYIEYAKDFPFNMETLSTIESQYIQTKELIDKIAKEVEISLPDLFHIPLRQVETYQHLISNVRHQLLGGEPSSEAIILEEAEYKLEEVTSVIDRIMLEVRKRTRSTRKRELIHKGMMAGQNEKAVLKMRYLFLYNDVLICARMPKTSDHASLYLPKWYLPLSDILLPLTHDPGKPMDTIQLKQLKVKIRELQRLLKEEDTNVIQDANKGPVSKRMRGFKKQRVKALKDSLNEKIDEYHVLHMNLPFKIISKRGKTYTMHIHGEKERDEWMRQIQAQLNKVPACTANISLSIAEVESLLERYTKLRKNSAIAKLDVDNDDETVYDGVLLVQVICGTELGEVGTKPDIYCTLEADCNGEMCKKNKTKLMKGSINPIWDETICVPAEACQFLRIRAYGKKKFQAPSEIGSKLLTLADYSLEDNSPKPLAINLQPKGQIKLTIQLLSLEQARLRKESQHQTFGVPLEELALIEGQKIPPIIHACFRQIERRGVMEEGIYRVNGIVGEIRRLKSAFDESARNGEILANEAEVNVVAGVVKQFFRELPKPLFPVEMYNDFVELLDSQDEADKEKMMIAFGDIPEPNISVIVRLIQHIKYIAEYQPRNKMDVNNLCLLFGPNVVKPPPCATTGQQTCESLTTTSMQQVNILKFFCEKPISRLQELHGDEESLRPGSAPPMLSPTSDRNVTPIVRHVSVASLAASEMIAEEEYNFDLEYSPVREDKRDQLANLGSLPNIHNGNCISPSSDLSEFPDCSRQSSVLGDDSSIDRSISSETGRSIELPIMKLSIDNEAKKSDSSEISPLSSTQSGDSVLSPSVPSICLDSPSAPHQGSDKTTPS